MTAVALVWNFDPDRPAKARGERMLSALRPYGAHHQALWSEGPVAVGRVLHRTTPEDAYDRQPASASGGATVIVADIRLDNRDELIAALALSAADAARMADSELLARAWDRWDEACLSRLVGDFAFALWDSRRRQVVCARDALGSRPLFYHRGRDFFAVASMPKGLLALPEVPHGLDGQMLGAFLAALPTAGAGNPFGGRSFYESVARLPPGCCLVADGETTTIRRHWSAQDAAPVRHARDTDYVEQARELFQRAVAAQLRSVGEVGSQLSAGLDSSSVAVTAAPILAERGQRLTCFTAVPRPGEAATIRSDRFADEGPLAADAARAFANIDHVRVAYPLVSPLEPVERSLFAFDEPMRNPCNLAWIDAIGRRAQAAGIRTMLHAPLGNATLSYNGHERFGQLLRRGNLLGWTIELARFASRSPRPWSRVRTALALSLPGRLRYDAQRAGGVWWTRLGGHSPLSADVVAAFDERKAPALRAWSDARLNRDPRVRIIDFADPGTSTAGALALHGFELRDPTADRRVVEFCLGLPLDQFYRDGQDRRLARRLMQGRLPAAILDGHGKGMQGVGWLRNLDFGRDAILAEVRSLRASPLGEKLLDVDALERLAQSIPAGAPSSLEDVASYRHKLLHGAAAARFIRHVEGANT